MKLHGLSIAGVDYTALSDSALDSAYAAGWNAGDSSVYTPAAVEIIHRKATPIGFLDSLMTKAFGGSAFPKYDAIQANAPQGAITDPFVSADTASTALTTSAANVANTLNLGGKIALLFVGLVATAVIASKVR